MKCVVEKSKLLEGLKSIKKVTGAVPLLYLKIKEDEDYLDLSATDESSYISYKIPIDGAVKGEAIIDMALADSVLSSMQKSSISIVKNKNEMRFVGGSKMNLYCKEEEFLIKPKISQKLTPLKIGSKETGILRKLLEKVRFEMMYSEIELERTPILIENKKKLSIGLADSSHCAYYFYKKPISKDKFTIITYLDYLKAVYSIISSSSTIKLSDSQLLIEADNVFASIPLIQTGLQSIELAKETVKSDKNLGKEVKVSSDVLNKGLETVSSISEGSGDFITLDIEKGKIKFSIESALGKGKSKPMDCETDIKKLKAQIPLSYFSNIVWACDIGKDVKLRFDNDMKFIKLETEYDKFSIKCVAPTLA
jgi:DNA polymerase III sliding clamp (beta) subunit (PCNA family)